MATDTIWTRSAPARQRLLMVVAVLAVVAAWRERSFARNRSRYGTPNVPPPS
ncbi:MAG: hypothetical protein U0Q22_18380 [Acidimicrobiales bacterium]